MRRFIKIIVIAAVAVLGLSVDASADSVLQFDLNSITADAASAGFSTGFTGTITLSDDGDSVLAAIKINGVDQGIGSGLLGSFSGTITLVGGTVTGGSFTLTDSLGAAYSATILSGSGDVDTQAGQGFTIDGLTFSGSFSGLDSGTDFAGVDVSDWDVPGGVVGSFLEFGFNPDSAGLDDNSDVDIYVIVPTPMALVWGLAGLGGVFASRKRIRSICKI